MLVFAIAAGCSQAKSEPVAANQAEVRKRAYAEALDLLDKENRELERLRSTPEDDAGHKAWQDAWSERNKGIVDGPLTKLSENIDAAYYGKIAAQHQRVAAAAAAKDALKH